MSDAVSPPQRRRRVARELSFDEARAKIVAKLLKAGRKGAPSLFPPKTSVADRATYASALAVLETAQEVYADRRKAKPKYYEWGSRPVLPSAESVADELALFAASRFPLLSSAADFKKHAGKAKAALWPGALERLVAEGRLLQLTLRVGKKETPLYASAESLHGALGAAARAPVSVAEAYAALVTRTGFPAVLISELVDETGVDVAEMHRWLLGEHRAGRAVLSLGDWSLASATQRAAALTLHGERYLQARLLV